MIEIWIIVFFNIEQFISKYIQSESEPIQLNSGYVPKYVNNVLILQVYDRQLTPTNHVDDMD